jgi:electron transport complex protein RnfD
MKFRTPSSPHFHGPATVTGVMLQVVYALIPGIIAYIWLFGWGVITNLVMATVTALATEAVMLHLRGRPLAMYLSDGSALVTAILLGLAIPPLAPWWVLFVGTAFAIVFAKHLYGGLGFNPFNPAMVGYVMLLISFPREMTAWPAPISLREMNLDLGQSLAYVFGGNLPAGVRLDALSMATPLDDLRTQLGLGKAVEQITSSPIFGMIGGTGWEWINIAFLAGGLWLIRKKIISWHVPVGMLGSLALISFLFFIIKPETHASPLFHLISGGAILGAFFIATDPVSGSTTPRGRLYFGIGVGVLTYIIRSWGGYPDAVAFSVLLMNMGAPTIDYYTRPRVFGHGGKSDAG